jgi:hypothetical protein
MPYNGMLHNETFGKENASNVIREALHDSIRKRQIEVLFASHK